MLICARKKSGAANMIVVCATKNCRCFVYCRSIVSDSRLGVQTGCITPHVTACDLQNGLIGQVQVAFGFMGLRQGPRWL